MSINKYADKQEVKMNFKLDHINLTVNNIEETIEWYAKVFDLKLLENGINNENNRWAIIGRNDSMICMTEQKNRLSPSIEEIEQYHQINHFGFRVPDRKTWEDKINKHKLKLYYGGINEYPNSCSWYVKDPTGYTIEVSYTNSEILKFPST